MIFEETVTLSRPFQEVVEHVKSAFASVGFGALTEIDMQATLKAKLDEDMDPYLIIGACNPKLASRALRVDPQLGALLPCNVVIRRLGENTIVEVMDPGLMATVSGNSDVTPIAAEARTLINHALAELTAAAELPSGS